ncbi:nucleotidyltransferase family protein [Flavobacteriaceae bacterium]|nr:nucleotidyltransferase family protein [Flavobacteriaceae bacterium]
MTINHEEHNKRIVEEVLQSNTVDWDAIVKLSTAHFVFPALYCNLKRASFLSYLPEDLVEYMKYITALNRERNEQILAQAEELNTLLLEHNITPIFIKGTGNLLEGLYEDIAERMVGDIDFLFSKEDYPRAIELLEKKGYYSIYKEDNSLIPCFRHYPTLVSNTKIAAVEIHKELLNKKYASEFNYDFIKVSIQKINDVQVLCYKNQLSLSIAAIHINDNGFEYKNFALRNAYDVFLLSKKTNAKNAFLEFNALQYPLHCFLASCFEVFNKPETLRYTNSKNIIIYLINFYKYINDRELAFKDFNKKERKKIIYNKFIIIFKSFFYKKYRVWLFKRITDKDWQKEKLIKLGIIKP